MPLIRCTREGPRGILRGMQRNDNGNREVTTVASAPSALEAALRESMPSDTAIPEPLCQALSFMEAKGWGGDDASGRPFLTPYAGQSQVGPVFCTGLSIRGWLNPDAPGAERLIPLAETDGSGGIAALWIDESGDPRFVGLSSEGGEGVPLANSALDFLRLVAVGYPEFTDWSFGSEPDAFDDDDDSAGHEAIEAHAQFRAWVESEFATTVPSLWEVQDDDSFNLWLQALVEKHGIGLD